MTSPEPGGSALRYATAEALDAAIKAKIALAVESGPYTANELRRQFAYDRFLTRVFVHQPNKWILKGGTGLLARIPNHARHSRDVDLFYEGQLDVATRGIGEAADLDLGDYFTFDTELAGELTGLNPGRKLKVVAYLGDTRFGNFEVDVVVASNMTGTPETVDPIRPISIDGLATRAYRAYPLVDHIADKHAAMIATYGGKPSTRYRDLIDIVLIASTHTIRAEPLRVALLSEYEHRQLSVPAEVSLPSDVWQAGYEQVAKTVPNFMFMEVQAGLDLAKAFLDPILQGRTDGTWHPQAHEWID